MKRLLAMLLMVFASSLGVSGVQASGYVKPNVVNAALACDGRVTFEVDNADYIEWEILTVTVYNGTTTVRAATVDLQNNQFSYVVSFDTSEWPNGATLHAEISNSGVGSTFYSIATNSVTCVAEPAPTPTQKPIANSFTITGWSRICASDNFRLSWSGTNLSEVVFYLFDNETQQRSSMSHVTDMTLSTVTVPVLLGNWDGFTAWPIFKDGQVGAQETHQVEPCGTPTDPGPTSTATAIPNTTPTPVPNTFALTSAQRMCTDQSFKATWTGSNLTSVEFALSNTSDNWTSGWLTADPATGVFTAPVDHHGYDKVMARATYADGSTAQADADVGTCAETPAPPPTVPPSKPAPSQPSAVTSLPVTGTGDAHYGVVQLAVVTSAVVLVGAITIIGRKRSMM